MRDVVILHARADAQVAERLGANPRVWVTDAVTANAPIGAFGQKFRLVALWSAAAEAQGLGPTYAALMSGREAPGLLLKVDGTPVPPYLAAIVGVVGAADPDGFEAGLAALAPAPRAQATTPRRSRIDFGRVLAAVAFSLGFGAVLANATQIEREQPLDAEFGLAPVAPAAIPPAAPTARGIDAVTGGDEVDAVAARAEALFAKAYTSARTPAAAARSRTVQAFHGSAD